MVQIPVYESRGSVTGGGMIAPEPASDMYNLSQVAGERLATELEKTRQIEDRMFASNKAAEMVRMSEKIREDMVKEGVPFESWGPEYRNRFDPQVQLLSNELTNDDLRMLVMDTANRTALSYESNLFEQGQKLKQDAMITEFQNNFETLQNARAKATGAERALLDEQIGFSLASAQQSGLLPASDIEKLKEGMAETDIRSMAVDGNIGGALQALNNSDLPLDKKVALKNAIETEGRQRTNEARQASMFARLGYERTLEMDPTSPELTDDALLNNAELTARDRESLKLARDRRLSGIGALPSQQEKLQADLETGSFNAMDRDSLNALNFMYQSKEMQPAEKVTIVAQSGVVPEKMAAEIATSIYNGNPEQQAAAYSLYAQIERTRPDATKRIEAAAPDLGARTQQYSNLVAGGLSPQEAAGKVNQAFANPPKDQETIKKINTDSNRFASNSVDDVLNNIKTQNELGLFDRVDYAPSAKGQVHAFLSEYTRSSMMSGSDLKAAQDYAKSKASQTFGLTLVGDAKRVMFAPPEKFTQVPSAKISQNVRGLLGNNVQEFSLVSDPVTQQQVMSGAQPTYAISFVDEFGGFRQLPVRVNPDGTPAQ